MENRVSSLFRPYLSLLLFIPADSIDNSEELREIIKEVNDTQLIEEEILSYSLYYYDAEIDEVRICD